MYGIFTYIWVIIRANVGKYTSTMEHMGNDSTPWFTIEQCLGKSLGWSINSAINANKDKIKHVDAFLNDAMSESYQAFLRLSRVWR